MVHRTRDHQDRDMSAVATPTHLKVRRKRKKPAIRGLRSRVASQPTEVLILLCRRHYGAAREQTSQNSSPFSRRNRKLIKVNDSAAILISQPSLRCTDVEVHLRRRLLRGERRVTNNIRLRHHHQAVASGLRTSKCSGRHRLSKTSLEGGRSCIERLLEPKAVADFTAVVMWRTREEFAIGSKPGRSRLTFRKTGVPASSRA
ncbi:hypothetical protein HPB51_022524 [Rhipicephalus microplus]|uniref:Uncharacterized protein n=1 Tax=Rhipicephalus microplus TaxID=6941 RepID=A0A9J6ECE1_RHIMP|nr:hypothetical protein HPB51_022524 [Rhipicephalus microplus]